MVLNKLIRHRRKVALSVLLAMTMQLVAPLKLKALTSGPSQPEMKGFEPLGTADMVDMFSGDLTYKIPLMDIDGYPIGLNYHSGSTPDDEASWVGFGWSLTPGAMTRQLRGLPDDFNGADKVVKTQNFKDHVTKGITAKVSAKIAGVPVGNFSLSAGVEYDNYRGIGTRLGANAGISIGDVIATPDGENNQDDDDSLPSGGGTSGGVSLGLSTSSMDGASADLNFNILKKNADQSESSLSSSIGFAYSSRAGLQGMTLSNSFDPGKAGAGSFTNLTHIGAPEIGGSSFISFAAPTYTPTIQAPTSAESYTLNLDAGGQVSFGYIGGGISGYYAHQYIKSSDQTQTLPAYGYMNMEKGRDDKHALMDFNREKDIPYSNEVLYLPVPVPTNDLFLASGEGGGGQYTIHRGEPGVLFDSYTGTSGNNSTLGIQAGLGDYFSIGGDFYYQTASTRTQKWTQNNNFLPVGDFSKQSTLNSTTEHAYFKRVGEPTVMDMTYSHSLQGDTAVRLNLTGSGTTVTASRTLAGAYSSQTPAGALGRTKRDVRIQSMDYLTASEAALGGLDKTLQSYPAGQVCLTGCATCGIQQIPRVGGYRQGHHLSQLTTVGEDGKRLVYGIPVYNTYQEETSFSIAHDDSKRAEGVIGYNPATDATVHNNNGTSGFFSKQTTPAYATSFLLTAILSPDYQDVTGDGITDDDLGTSVKFNYTLSPGLYQWRTPTDPNQANYNEGFLTDVNDDKASYTYGQKEVWYLHSIESKTHVALFITEARMDGFGVNGAAGGVNTGQPLQRLKEVRLYAKSDIVANGGDYTKATPIKTAHFVYSYGLMPGVPNTAGPGTGKLTLKQVYFTFGNNQKGALEPYSFTYYNEGLPLTYHHKQYDRWGTYKDPAANPAGMNNEEYPYTIQDTTVTNDFVSRWQLQTITLPSGGLITIHYQSDDYAYVQDQRASQLCQVTGVGTPGGTSGLTGPSAPVFVALPQPVSSQQDMMFRYFQNMPYLFFKCYLNLDGQGHQEYVPGYARIQSVRLYNATTAEIFLTPDNVSGVGNVNPIASTGWQFIRTNLPQWAYPGYSNLNDQGSDFAKAIKSLATALGNLSELLPNSFPKKAKRNHFSDQLDLAHSYVRLCSGNFSKLGGGSRVARIDMSDQWNAMAGAADAQTASYAQTYDYTTTTTDENGSTIKISSGVAAYEPLIGGEENPFHQPIFYRQNVILQLDNYYYVEQPYGESFYPAPNVGYSKVTVTKIGAGGQAGETGSGVSEFFTARDYPTQVSSLPMQKIYGQNSAILRLLFGKVQHSVGLSQGYVIENNDMHGKPKATSEYNQSGALVSSTRYSYRTRNPSAETLTLDNQVPLATPDGTIHDGVLGQDVQVFTDMREDISNNEGNSIRVSGGLAGLLWFPCPFFFPGPGANYDHRTYHSACMVKVVNNFGVVDKVIKTLNGSTITTQNLLWDAQTGEVVLTQTQNAYDDPIYSLSLPAYWMYDGMGAGYQDEGTYLGAIPTGAGGQITNAAFNTLLIPGDECLDLTSGSTYWVTNTDGNLRLINRDGSPVTTGAGPCKIVRSGRRNIISALSATFVTLQNPVVSGKLLTSYATKVISSTATEYAGVWNVPTAYCRYNPPPGYRLSADSTYFYQDVAGTDPDDPGGCETICAGDENDAYGANGITIYNADGSTYTASYTGNAYWNGGNACVAGGGGGEAFALKKAAAVKPLEVGPPANCNMTPALRMDTACGPLNFLGIWTCQGTGLIRANRTGRLPADEWIGFSRPFNAPSTKTYYLGVAADDYYKVRIDGITVVDRSITQGDFSAWYVYPIQLTQGAHVIEMQAENVEAGASMAAEIYNASPSQIMNAQSYNDLDTLFSTYSMIGGNLWNVATACPAGYTFDPNEAGVSTPCRSKIPINGYINPYVSDYVGNWRTVRVNQFQVNREQLVARPALAIPGATNIRTSGAFADFQPFWQYNAAQPGWQANPAADPRWVWHEEATAVNPRGLDIETKNALGNYSAALFGYLESTPVAVANNAENREIAYDGFEDYNLALQCASGCPFHHFDFMPYLNGTSVQVSTQRSHTGNSSLQLTAPVTLTRQLYPDAPAASCYVDATGNYRPAFNQWTQGFCPIAGKQYLLSLWVYDGQPRQSTTSMGLLVNGTNLLNSAMTFPVVEGWKRVEVNFTVPPGAGSFALTLQPSGTLYVDDIRIEPFQSDMKTFCYDAASLRLMAELDENNFATFYEYDDQGLLIRIKRETEKGIQTIQESRLSHRYQATQ